MRVRALMIRILTQFIHDKRTLALMIVAPILILYMMSLVFGSGPSLVKIGVVNVPAVYSDALIKQGAAVTAYSADVANTLLAKTSLDAIISMKDSVPQIRLEGSNP